MSTEGAFCIFGELTDTKWTTALLTTVDPCVYCGKSTAFGSGRFVNRTHCEGVVMDRLERSGWGCAECAGPECDRCKKQIYIDEDVMADQCGGEWEFTDGAVHVCEACLTETEAKAYESEVDDPCIYCGKSTAFGSGRFVNRLASDVGWGCAECSGYPCDRCGIQMYLDCEVMADQCGGDEAFDDGTVHVCEACLTETEAKAYAKE